MYAAPVCQWLLQVWDDVFPPDDILAAPLGMGGSTLEVSGNGSGVRISSMKLASSRPGAGAFTLLFMHRAAHGMPSLLGFATTAALATKHVPACVHTAQELAARLVCGGEAPAVPPKVVVLLAGYNNARYVRSSSPAELMDWILQVWCSWWVRGGL